MSRFHMARSARATLFVLSIVITTGFVQAAGVEVSNAWARGTVPAQTASGAYLDIRSSASARLIGAASPVAEAVEIHTMSLEGGVMKMLSVKSIELPPGNTVHLAPGGYHFMLLGLRQQLKAGEVMPLTLKVQGADGKVQEVEVQVPVRALSSSGGGRSHH